MLRFFFGVLLTVFIGVFFFRFHNHDLQDNESSTQFSLGEVLSYRVKYGAITIGRATVTIAPTLYTVRSKSCYKVEFHLWTVGILSWVSKIEDWFGAYIDTEKLLSYISYRKLQENKYRMDEITLFDHKHNHVKMREMDWEKTKYNPFVLYAIPKDTRDILSGYLYGRSLDMTSFQQGDTLMANGFLHDKVYPFGIVYKGKETVKVKVGKIKCLKFVSIMPDNDLFDGENALSFWVSDDESKVLVKMGMKMVVAQFQVVLTDAQGLKNPLNGMRSR